MAGYIVDNTGGNWTLIGKKDPSLPQINEDQNDNLIVNGGDNLVVRCTFVSIYTVTSGKTNYKTNYIEFF